MNSDSEGNYGYDIPANDGGLGFRIGDSSTTKPSHLVGNNNYSSGDDDENQNNNSSDDDDGDDGDDHDDGNNNFSYGAYAARKRRKREHQSKSTDKERALYGVFCQDSSDDEGGGGTRGRSGRQRTTATTAGNRRQRGRHFDKRQNRMAGLAFVKGSSNNDAAVAGDDAGEDDDAKDKVTDDGRRSNDYGANSVDKSNLEREGKKKQKQKKTKLISEPDWLKEKPRVNKKASSPSREDKATNTGDANSNDETINVNSDDMDIENDETVDVDANNEEEMNLIHERQNRFKELLVIARTSTTKQNNKYRERQKQQQSAVPDSDVGIGSRGIGFENVNQKGDGRSSKPSISEASIGGGIGLGAAANGGIVGLGYRPHAATTSERETESAPRTTTKGLGMDGTMGIGTPGLGAAAGSRRGLGMGSSTAGMGIGSTPGAGGLGLGMSTGIGFSSSQDSDFPSFSPSGTMMGGGLGRLGHEVPQKKKKKDPNLGKWEKHTKGIGMKLLQKMGYEGSGGLGAKRKQKDIHRETAETTVRDDRFDPPTAAPAQEEVSVKKGISRPVEVVVRPNGLGLGFGNFKEQSQLKVNRQIEAEVRGLKLPEEEQRPKAKAKGKGIYDGIDESLLPSTESLLSGANGWRRGNKKRAKRKIVSYRDILDKGAADGGDGPSKLKIIDMRGTSTLPKGGTATTTMDSATAVLIGEELLHNVTLLLNTHEGQLRTSSYMVENAERKVASLESECKEMNERKEGAKRRSDKMKLALDVVEEAEVLVERMTTMEKDRNVSENGRLDFAMDSLQRIFANLYSNFSREERMSLKFDATLIPSIVNPLVDSLTSTLNPLRMGDYMSWMNRLAVGIQKLCATTGSDNEAYALREIIFTQSIAPWITRSLSSTKWDPVANGETGLGIYEALLNCACESFPEAESEENDILKDTITNEVVNNAVLPKLLRAVSRWRPEMDRARQRIDNPLHLWILPWLPHIADDATLATLLADVRRNSKKTLSFLGKSVSDDAAFVRACISTLDPWKRLLGESAIFELTSDLVAPRIARSLARVEVRIVSADQDWEQLHVLFDYFEKGLMSGDEFVSLIEGEVLPAWSYALHCALKRKDRGDTHDFKGCYMAWKGQFFDLSANARGTTLSPQVVLRSDPMVCRYFFGGLKMIEAAHKSNETLLDDLRPTHPSDYNYRISLMHRSKVRQPQNSEESSDVNVRVRRRVQKNGNAGVAPTFQEVVESFANQHDITFHPKSGSNSKRDGKPVFMFGDHPVYFDKNVLFAKRGSAWRPISLEHLAQSC